MSNLSDDSHGRFLVVVNDEGQHSLWHGPSPVPDGWNVVHGPADRSSCLEYVNENWTDMRPRSLVDHIGSPQPGHGR